MKALERGHARLNPGPSLCFLPAGRKPGKQAAKAKQKLQKGLKSKVKL